MKRPRARGSFFFGSSRRESDRALSIVKFERYRLDIERMEGKKYDRGGASSGRAIARAMPLFTAGIRSVSYRPASDADTRAESRVPVMSNAMFELGQPKPRGVFDASMGTTDSAYLCASCGMGKEKCHGHPGHFDLNYPCLSPIALAEIKKWLKIVCFNCGGIIVSDADIARITGTSSARARLDALAKHLPSARRACARCGAMHLAIQRPDRTKFTFTMRDVDASGIASDVPLYPHNIAEIFDRVSDNTVAALGRTALVHPRAFVWRCIYVPPPAIRPDTKRMGGRGSGNDSITSHIKDIIHYHNQRIKPSIPQEIDPKYAVAINAQGEMLAEMLVRINERAKSISMRLKGKRGRMRDNLLGKRAFGMGRSTIDGSPRLNLDQISIPLFIAQTLQIEEVVQDFNRERLLVFVANGTQRYPGCSRVAKRDGGVFKPEAPGLRLESGDIVMRDLVNGDIVAFNRQPTLTLSNITSVRVVIDRTALANGMSVLICPFFNADFDGDQMNIFNYAHAASLNEQIMMTNVASRMVSATTGSMFIGQSGDSLVGLMKITQHGIALDKYHAGLVFSSTNCAPDLSRDALITGHDIVSFALERTPINYRGKSGYYNPDQPWMKWMPRSRESEIVEIAGGRLLRGCLDKPSIGAGAGSIYQRMVHEYGPRRTLDAIYDMQQVGINFLSQHGFTTGVRDFAIAPGERAKIDAISQATLTRAYQAVDQLNRGQIVPPIGKTVRQFYEDRQINIQRVADEFYEPVIRSIADPRANGVFEMMAVGKGSPTYLVNMVATVGLVMISGARARANFGYERTLPYFQRFEEAPEARGYVAASFMGGLPLVGCIYNAMMARTDIISRALMTSITGDQNRKSIKSLESVITNNHRMTIKGADIVSLVYGGDYYDPRALETVIYGPAMLSDAALAARYRFAAANPSRQGVFDEEYARIVADRAEYRRIRGTIERLSVRDKMDGAIKMPFNVARIAERVATALRDGASTGARVVADDDLAAAVARVREFCDDFPYLFINDEQRRARGWVPEFARAAGTWARMYLRAELCAVRVREMSAGVHVSADSFARAVLDAIAETVLAALIDPGQAVGIIAAQSFSEPFTQDMLDSYKQSALTGGNASRIKMSKCREVMNAYGVDRLGGPVMTIALREEWARSRERAHEVALRLEMLRFSQLVVTSQIFYERFGEVIHPAYADEREWIDQFVADNPMFAPPGDLAPWCMRFEISKGELVLKNISMRDVIIALRDRFADLYVVYTTERARRVVVRAYIRAPGLDRFAAGGGRRRSRRGGAAGRVRDAYDIILETIIRGIAGIRAARAERLICTRTDDDGAIVEDMNYWGVMTQGTNMLRAARVEGVRADAIQTDAIQELAAVLGIEAARNRIITEMRGLVEKCNVRHYMIYADEMTRTGHVTSIERGGLSVREANNVALRAGQAAPVQVFTEAALGARRDILGGVSGPLTFGAVPRVGTLYNAFIIDPDVIKKYKRTAAQVLDDL
jgi:DNA-directed RNA polymerase beta' subunit